MGRPKGKTDSRPRVRRTKKEVARERLAKAAIGQKPSHRLAITTPHQFAAALIAEYSDALDLLNRQGTPLHVLIAEAMQNDTGKMLSILQRAAPVTADVSVSGQVDLTAALARIDQAIVATATAPAIEADATDAAFEVIEAVEAVEAVEAGGQAVGQAGGQAGGQAVETDRSD